MAHLPGESVLDRFGEGVFVAGEDLQVQAGGGDAFVAEPSLDLAGGGTVLLHRPGEGVAQGVYATHAEALLSSALALSVQQIVEWFVLRW